MKLLSEEVVNGDLNRTMDPSTVLLAITYMAITVQSTCDYPDALKPPFSDDVCAGSGDGNGISGILALFLSQLTSDVDLVETDNNVLNEWEECLSDDYMTDFCDDCVAHSLSWKEEGPLDVAFWNLFEEVTTMESTEEIHCTDTNTIQSSFNVTAKLPGVPLPISWRATFQMEFDDDGTFCILCSICFCYLTFPIDKFAA